MSKSLALFIAFSGLVHAAHAEETGLSKQFSTCIDKSGGVTSTMLDCIGSETKVQDARLNKAYKYVIATLSPSRKTELQEAQRAWIKFRDANCRFYLDPDGGTMASVNSADCLMSTTANRAKELEAFRAQ
jgi:uncharacterized protein YecT (DUF1311 family)